LRPGPGPGGLRADHRLPRRHPRPRLPPPGALLLARSGFLGPGDRLHLCQNPPGERDHAEAVRARLLAGSRLGAPRLPGPRRSPPAAPAPADRAKAVARFSEAEARYRAGQYEEALAGYKDAYILSREPDLLINVGQCLYHLGRYEEALRTYRIYLHDVPESPY